MPSADDLHDHTDNQPPKRQSAQRTRNIIPEALLELDNARVSHQDGQKRQIDGDAHGNDKQQSKRIKIGNEGAMKVHTLDDDEDSDLTDLSDEEEAEEEEAKMTDSKATDDTRDSSPAPEEAPGEVSHRQIEVSTSLLWFYLNAVLVGRKRVSTRLVPTASIRGTHRK